MHVIMIGPPGSGKGTQSSMIADEYGLAHISTGDLLRAEAKKKTRLAKMIKSLIDKGNLVPDEATTGILIKRLKKKDCTKGFVLDGYPRNINQAKLLGSHYKIDHVLYIDVSEGELIRRLSGRWQCSKCDAIYGMGAEPKKKGLCDKCGSALYQRADDKPAAIKKRIDTFNSLTKALINHYRKEGLLRRINGSKKPEQVFEAVKKILI